jgi:hypothetical protein
MKELLYSRGPLLRPNSGAVGCKVPSCNRVRAMRSKKDAIWR